MGDDCMLIFRGFERLLATSGGIVSLICGMLLYKWGTSGTSQLVIENKDTKFRMTNAGPGLLLGLFGMAVVGISLFRPLDTKTERKTEMVINGLGERKVISTEKSGISYTGEVDPTVGQFLADFSKYQFDTHDLKELSESIAGFQKRAKDAQKKLVELQATSK